MKAARGNAIITTESKIDSLRKELRELKTLISTDKNYLDKSLTVRKYQIINELSKLTLTKKVTPVFKTDKETEDSFDFGSFADM